MTCECTDKQTFTDGMGLASYSGPDPVRSGPIPHVRTRSQK